MGILNIITICVLLYHIGKYIGTLFPEGKIKPKPQAPPKVKYIYNGVELKRSFLSEYSVILDLDDLHELNPIKVERSYNNLVDSSVWTKVTLEDREWVYYHEDYNNARSYLLDYCDYMSSMN